MINEIGLIGEPLGDIVPFLEKVMLREGGPEAHKKAYRDYLKNRKKGKLLTKGEFVNIGMQAIKALDRIRAQEGFNNYEELLQKYPHT